MTRRDLEQRLANTTWSRPPSDVPMGTCWCGGAYMDTDIGHDSHEVVMGHRPAKKNRSASESGAMRADDAKAASARDPTTDPGQNDDPDDSTTEQE